MEKIVCLKVDVDTYLGMKECVPRLLRTLAEYRIKASFFIPTGPDHTGRAIRRIFTRRGFLKKVARTNVIKNYGLRTLLYGLILPGPEILKGNIGVLHRIAAESHEVGIHGHDHVFWHDRILSLDYEKTKGEIMKSIKAFESAFGKRPTSFAAPGWMINVHAYRVLREESFLYSSSTRASQPFYPIFGEESVDILEIPTTLPTLDEILGRECSSPKSLAQMIFSSLSQTFNVFTIHAELEGRNWEDFLRFFLEMALSSRYSFVTLKDFSIGLSPSKITGKKIFYGEIQGRAGLVTCAQ